MNILKKSLAPITDKAWEEINEQSERIFKNFCSGRKFVDIDGPNGIEFGGISTGRLIVPDKESKEGVNYGIREMMPLIEVRKPFELDLWELDNLERGAEDVNLEPLEKAAKEFAFFEENVIYKGFEKAGIQGIQQSAEGEPKKIPEDLNSFLKLIGGEITSLQSDGVQGPYSLIINSEKWQNLISLAEGYPVQKQVEEILQGKVIVSQGIKDSFLVSQRGGDFELTVGQDTAIGFDSQTTNKVKLYFTESFTFRVLSPEAVRVLAA